MDGSLGEEEAGSQGDEEERVWQYVQQQSDDDYRPSEDDGAVLAAPRWEQSRGSGEHATAAAGAQRRPQVLKGFLWLSWECTKLGAEC